MPGTQCCVGGCCNQRQKDSNLSLHTFPRNNVLRQKWVASIRNTGTDCSRGGTWKGPQSGKCWKSQQVCSEHFTIESFIARCRLHWQEGITYRARLEDEAVPTLFGSQINAYRNREPLVRGAFRKREVARIIKEYTSTETEPAVDNFEDEDEVENGDDDLDATWNYSESTSVVCSAISKQKKNGNGRSKGVQVNLKGRSTQTCVKGTITLRKHHTKMVSKSTQYLLDDCAPHPGPPLPTASTPVKAVPIRFQPQSPALDSTLSSVVTEGIDKDPDYEPFLDESDEFDVHEPELDRKSPIDERKFLVFEENLLSLFQVCSRCQGTTTAAIGHTIGTYVTVNEECSCGYTRRWESQPMIGDKPAGNLLLSASVLFAGCNITQVFRVFKILNMLSMSLSTFWRHQKNILWPVIDSVWGKCSSGLLAQIRERGGRVTVAGDGRADSVGHCAKYGTYSLIDMDTDKVIGVQLVQSNEVKSSYHMELEGLKRSVAALQDEQITIAEIVTDRHLQIQKWIRENLQDTKHRYDVWHIAKGIKKKLLAMAKVKNCEVIHKWIRSITNHVYWSATSTEDGDGEVVLSKWKSVANHVQDFHEGHEGPFSNCAHEKLTDREWLKSGSLPCSKLEDLVLNKRLCGDVRKMSTGAQTSTLESFHSVINHFAPKMTVYSYHGQLCRQLLAALHFNENTLRPKAVTKDGQVCVRVTFPKYKLDNDFSVKYVRESATYRYVQELLEETVNVGSRTIPTPALTNPAPPPLTSGKRKPTKEEAVAVLIRRAKKSKQVLEDRF